MTEARNPQDQRHGDGVEDVHRQVEVGRAVGEDLLGAGQHVLPVAGGPLELLQRVEDDHQPLVAGGLGARVELPDGVHDLGDEGSELAVERGADLGAEEGAGLEVEDHPTAERGVAHAGELDVNRGAGGHLFQLHLRLGQPVPEAPERAVLERLPGVLALGLEDPPLGLGEDGDEDVGDVDGVVEVNHVLGVDEDGEQVRARLVLEPRLEAVQLRRLARPRQAGEQLERRPLRELGELDLARELLHPVTPARLRHRSVEDEALVVVGQRLPRVAELVVPRAELLLDRGRHGGG